jgi:hypothetical protein
VSTRTVDISTLIGSIPGVYGGRLLLLRSGFPMIYTANVRDFPSLHAPWMESGNAHAGIVVRYHQRTPTGPQVRGLLRKYAAFPDGASDRLEVLEDWLRVETP